MSPVVDQSLKFSVSGVSFGSPATANHGLEIFASADIVAPSASSFCQSTDFGGVVTALPLCSQQIVSHLGHPNIQIMRVAVASLADRTKLESPSYFTIGNVQVMKKSSLYADGFLDFYINVIPDGYNMGAPTPQAPVQRMIVNSYAAPAEALSSLRLQVSNFWTSTTEHLTGAEFPAFIRISGYFSNVEQGFSKLVVFFDQLTTFPSASDERLQACASTMPSVRCRAFAGSADLTEWFNYPRLEIYSDFENTQINSLSPMEIVVPVATVTDKERVNLKAATVGTANGLHFLSPTVTYTYADKLALSLEQFNAQGSYTEIQGHNYRVDSQDKAVGSVSGTNLFCYHTQSQNKFKPNSDLSSTSKGAALVYVGKWNFYADSQFAVLYGSALSPVLDHTPAQDKKCLTVTYRYAPDALYPDRYALFCPVENAVAATNASKIALLNFQFPAIYGAIMPDAYSALSSKEGQMVKFQLDDQLGTLTPNQLLMGDLPLSFDLYSGQNSQRPVLTFTTTNPLPRYFAVKVQSPSTLNFQVARACSRCHSRLVPLLVLRPYSQNAPALTLADSR